MPVTDTFYCIGVSYKKADAALRGRFSITSKAIPFLLEDTKKKGISSLVLSSTCNRTELYAEAPNQQILVDTVYTIPRQPHRTDNARSNTDVNVVNLHVKYAGRLGNTAV